MKLLIVGCGYVGCEVARRYASTFADHDPAVFALTRTVSRASELAAEGIEPIVGDWLDPDIHLPPTEHVLVAVPHREVNALGANTHVRGLANLNDQWQAMPPNQRPHRLVYLSTTGVYGSVENEVVDEATPVSPQRIGPQMAVAAERWLTSAASSLPPATVLRLAGIYGPGRIPLADKVRRGEGLAVPRDGHLNLVHVVDIGRVICQLFKIEPQHPLYVFSDGQPVPRENFYRELASLCGVDNPKFIDPDPNDPRVRRATDKRVNPARVVGELDFVFSFPDYRTGLQNSLQSHERASE
jgi:nucleoside-diphosphate-sugar epimerase